MLEPDNRHLLVDALRPPQGMELDQAIATTFTLDLEAMLMAPVAFALFDGEAGEQPNPLALLEALRRYADRITVFCQSGAVAVPKKLTSMSAWLEESVVPVRPPPGHLFHPKLWAMRFSNPEGKTASRLLISSRNLTFDNSWDTFVRLDGSVHPAPERRKRAAKKNAPLVALLRALPEMAVHPLAEARGQDLESLINTLAVTSWENPSNARLGKFFPLGIEGTKAPRLTGDRSLIVSPFLGESTLGSLTKEGSGHVLVSRPSSLDEIPPCALSGFDQIFVLDVDPVPVDDQSTEETTGPGSSSRIAPSGSGDDGRIELSGLHAKVYIVESGQRTRLYFGSANASEHAFGGNIELLVQFIASKGTSIESILGNEDSRQSFRHLLLDYKTTIEEVAEVDPLKAAQRQLEHQLYRLAARPFELVVAGPSDGSYPMALRWQGALESEANCTLTAKLATMPDSTRRPIDGGIRSLDLGSVELTSLSSFVVLRSSITVDGQHVVASTLVNAKLIGAPADRKARLVSSLIENSDDLLRYLLFLLQEFDDGGDMSLLSAELARGTSDWGQGLQAPLLESLLRALARGGRTIERVASLLTDLETASENFVIPEDLRSVWEPVLEVWNEQSGHSA